MLRNVNKYLTRYPVFCYAPLPSGLMFISLLPLAFSAKASGGRTRGPLQFILHHLCPSGEFPHSLHVQHIPVAYTAATNSEQTHNLPIVYTNKIPICHVCPLCRAGSEQMHQGRGGAELQLGTKNAYSSLWLVQKLAAGGLGLGLGPRPESQSWLSSWLLC